MGWINTGNTNTLELNLTDYGKSLAFQGGISLKDSIVSFGLKDSGIDYRRFSRAPVPGSTDTQTHGPCFDQQYSENQFNERLSGDCFYNYPDVRGRVKDNVCNQSVSLRYNFADLDSNLHVEGPADNLQLPSTQDCFSPGYNPNIFGMNEYGCSCFGSYSSPYYQFDYGQGPGCAYCGMYNNNSIPLDPVWPTLSTIAHILQVYADINNITDGVGNAYVVMPNWTANWGGAGNYGQPGSYGGPAGSGLVGGGGIVGDIYGDGTLGCQDFVWMMQCYCTGYNQGANDYYNSVWFYAPNQGQFPAGVSFAGSVNAALDTFNCFNALNANCDGTTIGQ